MNSPRALLLAKEKQPDPYFPVSDERPDDFCRN